MCIRAIWHFLGTVMPFFFFIFWSTFNFVVIHISIHSLLFVEINFVMNWSVSKRIVGFHVSKKKRPKNYDSVLCRPYHTCTAAIPYHTMRVHRTVYSVHCTLYCTVYSVQPPTLLQQPGQILPQFNCRPLAPYSAVQ